VAGSATYTVNNLEQLDMSQSVSAVKKKFKFKRTSLAQSIRHQLPLPRVSAITAMTVMTMSMPSFAQSFSAEIELSELDGTDGFVLNGVAAGDFSGDAVSGAGDVNGDGVDDFIVSASRASSNAIASGTVYVVFGSNAIGIDGVVELSDLDGTNGFEIRGTNTQDYAGHAVSEAGDINGDGVDDLIIGTVRPDFDNTDPGESFVVFGGTDVGVGGVIELSALNGRDGFVLNGADDGDDSGNSVSGAGDVNDDGVDDLIIGATGANPNGSQSGESYVVFGADEIGSSGVFELSDLDGTNGFALHGINAGDFSGGAVSGAGDINGDGVDDVLISAPRAAANGTQSGESYVVFGGSGVGNGGVFELSDLDGSNGFVLNGINFGDRSGSSLSGAGDINGDGVNDLVIGAPGADRNGQQDAGESYVVFGGSEVGVGGVIELSDLNGSAGFALIGVGRTDSAGYSVSEAGDVNGDGVDDLIIGAPKANSNGQRRLTGEGYVVFGGSGVGSGGAFRLASLDGTNGFQINGIDIGDDLGSSVSGIGDVNGDGVDDVIIGAPRAFSNGNSDGGESYVVFGGPPEPEPTFTCNGLAVTVNLALGQSPTNGSDVILGTENADTIRALDGDDTICGLGGNDLINAGNGDDWVDAGAGNDRVFGTSGADFLRGRSGADRIFGGSGEDWINGDGGPDVLFGDLDDDLIYGGGGSDEVFGRTGRDVLFGGPGNDFVDGGAGADRIDGGTGADTMDGGNGTDSCSVDNVGDSVSRCAAN